eukprot:4449508-Lingulodinium_polyedra.AAC.1
MAVFALPERETRTVCVLRHAGSGLQNTAAALPNREEVCCCSPWTFTRTTAGNQDESTGSRGQSAQW